MNNPQVMIQKPFPGLMEGATYDYFMFFKNMGKLGLFWPEIECWLTILPSTALKGNISFDLFYKQPLLCIHWAH